jgi:hypothetical protein
MREDGVWRVFAVESLTYRKHDTTTRLTIRMCHPQHLNYIYQISTLTEQWNENNNS